MPILNLLDSIKNLKKIKRRGSYSAEMEKAKQSLIAASMLSMRSTLIKDYKVPENSPFLLQSEDLNIANLLSTVAGNECENFKKNDQPHGLSR